MRHILFCFLVATFVAGCNDPAPAPVPVPSPVPTVTVTPSPKPTPVPSPSPSPVPTPSPSPSPSPSPVPVSELFSASSAVHAQVDKYVNRFVADAIINGVDGVKLFKTGAKLKIQIASLDNLGAGVIGLCETGGGSRTLTLDPDFFRSTMDDVQNQILVYHELGHCVLFRPHRSEQGSIPDGSGHSHELSIMYPIIMGTAQYNFHKPYYDDELYTELSVADEPQVYICR